MASTGGSANSPLLHLLAHTSESFLTDAAEDAGDSDSHQFYISLPLATWSCPRICSPSVFKCNQWAYRVCVLFIMLSWDLCLSMKFSCISAGLQNPYCSWVFSASAPICNFRWFSMLILPVFVWFRLGSVLIPAQFYFKSYPSLVQKEKIFVENKEVKKNVKRELHTR